VKISSRPAEDAAFANLLGGPFLQNFYSSIVPKEITVTSPPSELHVLALPTSGRPADFSGAVGAFKVSSDVSADKMTAGDPVTLRMHVSGAGNFDRVDSPMLDHIDHWKTYPPKSSFSSTDPLGYKGEKTFEQPLIAAQTGEQTIPGLSFSFFDPETRHYERSQTAPIKVTIDASRADSSLQAPAGAAKADTRLAGRTDLGLRSDHALTEESAASLLPLYLRPRFLALPATLALLLTSGLIGLRRAPRRVASKAAQRALAQLSAVARAGDSSAFLVAARQILLQNFSQRWQLPPQQITAAELDLRLGSDAEDINRLFALADEAKYSGRAADEADRSQWLQIVSRQLTHEDPP
jgi:hypothetical protein